jgi:oxygen-dependent protoporphyrinogen oxidase
MTSPSPRPDLVVIGGGIAGLTVARDVALAGRTVVVLEGAAEPGGSVRSHLVGGLRLDRGAESFAVARPGARELVRELDLPTVAPTPAPAWVRHEAGQAPLPRGGLLGIPADSRAADVVAVLGRLGAWRAGVDALLPAGWGWSEGTLGGLVRRRLGRRVLRRLVDPVAGGVYSSDPTELDVDIVAPGLRSASREAGSLAKGVARLRGRAGAPAGAAVEGIVGGMARLTGALVDAVGEAGGQVNCHAPVTDLRRAADGGWVVTVGGPLPCRIGADRVVVAVPAGAADGLLRVATGGTTGHPDPTSSTTVVVVTLVVCSPALDGAPRGTGMLVASRSPGVAAKALTHATAKWAWLAQVAGSGVHVLRLSYGRGVRADLPVARLPNDSDFPATALADASALLGVPLGAPDLIDHAVVRYRDQVPVFRAGQGAAIAQMRSALADVRGLWVAGSAVAGTGLAAVISDARATAREILDRAAAG